MTGKDNFKLQICVSCMWMVLQHSIDFVLYLYRKHNIYIQACFSIWGEDKVFHNKPFWDQETRAEQQRKPHWPRFLPDMSQHELVWHGDVNKTAWLPHTTQCIFLLFLASMCLHQLNVWITDFHFFFVCVCICVCVLVHTLLTCMYSICVFLCVSVSACQFLSVWISHSPTDQPSWFVRSISSTLTHSANTQKLEMFAI